MDIDRINAAPCAQRGLIGQAGRGDGRCVCAVAQINLDHFDGDVMDCNGLGPVHKVKASDRHHAFKVRGINQANRTGGCIRVIAAIDQQGVTAAVGRHRRTRCENIESVDRDNRVNRCQRPRSISDTDRIIPEPRIDLQRNICALNRNVIRATCRVQHNVVGADMRHANGRGTGDGQRIIVDNDHVAIVRPVKAHSRCTRPGVIDDHIKTRPFGRVDAVRLGRSGRLCIQCRGAIKGGHGNNVAIDPNGPIQIVDHHAVGRIRSAGQGDIFKDTVQVFEGRAVPDIALRARDSADHKAVFEQAEVIARKAFDQRITGIIRAAVKEGVKALAACDRVIVRAAINPVVKGRTDNRIAAVIAIQLKCDGVLREPLGIYGVTGCASVNDQPVTGGTAEIVQHDRDRGIRPVPLYVDLDVACIHGVLQQRKGVYAGGAVDDDGVRVVVCGPFARPRTVGWRVTETRTLDRQIVFDDQAVDTLARDIVDDDRIIAAKQLNLNRARATADIHAARIVAVTDHDRSFAEAGSVSTRRTGHKYGILGARPVDRQNAGSCQRTEDQVGTRATIDRIRAFAAINFVCAGPAVDGVATRTAKHDVIARARQDCRGTRPQLLDKVIPAACVDIDRIGAA